MVWLGFWALGLVLHAVSRAMLFLDMGGILNRGSELQV